MLAGLAERAATCQVIGYICIFTRLAGASFTSGSEGKWVKQWQKGVQKSRCSRTKKRDRASREVEGRAKSCHVIILRS